MSLFYVSSSGDDAAPGTAQAPWRTLERVQESLSAGTITPGDSVFWKCGEWFWGGISQSHQENTFGLRVNHLSYGYGAMPIISGFKQLYSVTWAAVGGNVWSTSIAANAPGVTGASHLPSTGVGFLEVDGVIWGGLKTSLAQLVEQWDFFVDGDILYVKSTGNPGTLGGIRAASKTNGISTSGATHVQGLDFYGHGGHGVRIGTGSNVGIIGNRIRAIGGCLLPDGRRYGNGVETWVSSRDVLAEGNAISDVYDVAMTFQGNADTAIGWHNCVYRKNLIWNCTQSFEVWATGVAGATGLVNCAFEDNDCYAAGYGWGYTWRPDQLGRGVHVLKYNVTTPCDLVIRGNKFIGARSAYFYNGQADGSIPPDWRQGDNEIALAPGQRVEWQRAHLMSDAQAWVNERGLDRRSRFFPNPDIIETMDDAIQALSAGQRKERSKATAPGPLASDIVDESYNTLTFGNWTSPQYTSFGQGATVNRMLLMPVMVGGGLISRIAFRVMVAGAAGTSVGLGIYRGNIDRGFTLLRTVGNSDMTTGLKQSGIANLPVGRNEVIWIAAVVLGTGTTPALETVTSPHPYIHARSADGAMGATRVALQLDISGGNMPSTIAPFVAQPHSAGYRVAVGNA